MKLYKNCKNQTVAEMNMLQNCKYFSCILHLVISYHSCTTSAERLTPAIQGVVWCSSWADFGRAADHCYMYGPLDRHFRRPTPFRSKSSLSTSGLQIHPNNVRGLCIGRPIRVCSSFLLGMTLTYLAHQPIEQMNLTSPSLLRLILLCPSV